MLSEGLGMENSLAKTVTMCNTIAMKEILTDMERLREIALDQQGLVTRRQALEAGVSSGSLRQLAHRGRLERMSQGVYRVPQAPYDDRTGLRLALLWTGRDDAALGFETALDCYGVCDIFTDDVHVVVPAGTRIRRENGEGYVLHREDLQEEDRSWWEGMPITTLERTLLDCVSWGTPTYLIRQAVDTAHRDGLIGDKFAGEAVALMSARI